MPAAPKKKNLAPSPIKAYTTKPGITVDAQGIWQYQAQAIENTSILSYFKQQLRRDAKGYYIENIFGERREHAYLDRVKGFPLQVRTITPLRSQSLLTPGREEFSVQVDLDSHENISVPAQNLYILGADKMVLILSTRGGVPARLSPSAMTSLMSYLHQDEHENYFLVLPAVQCKQKLISAKAEDFLQL